MMEEQFPAWADRIEYWHVDDLELHRGNAGPLPILRRGTGQAAATRKENEPSGAAVGTRRVKTL